MKGITLIGALAITSAIFLAVSLVVGNGPGAGVAGTLGALAAWTWFYIPAVTFRRQS